MDNRPIGVFDSGLGGLTAVKELEKALPKESIIYFGDTGRVPYGTKSRETIVRYAKQDTAFLMQHGVKAILAACGTVSSVASEIGVNLPLPYFDVIIPTVTAAVNNTKNGKIGVIGTPATISSDCYKNAISRINKDIEVISQPCALFVPLVENNFISPDDPITVLTAKRYLQPLIDRQVDTLILGCTHYPILSDAIASVMGSGVKLINSGQEAALALAHMLREKDLLCDIGGERKTSYFVTDSPYNFLSVAEMLLGHSIDGDISRIDIEKI